jgi:hypothetical protein
VVDLLLALQFGVVHSLLLLPSVRRGMARIMPSQLYGTLFCLVTCVGLWLVFAYWQGSSAILWKATGFGRLAMLSGFYSSWLALFYSLRLTGIGYQTGWTQWLYWLRRQSLPLREFQARGAYRWLRHPVYLSFLGLIWFTPRMSADHAVFSLEAVSKIGGSNSIWVIRTESTLAACRDIRECFLVRLGNGGCQNHRTATGPSLRTQCGELRKTAVCRTEA